MNAPQSPSSVQKPRDIFQGLAEFGSRAMSYVSLMRLRSPLQIDVFIPAAEKDVDVLGYAIDGVRYNVKHPIANLFVVAPHSAAIQALCRRKHCDFVYERDLVDMKPADIGLVVRGQDRSAWLYQQFLKWSADALASTTHYLVVDADTVLIRPQVYECNGRTILNFGDEYHRPYFDFYERLLKETPACPVSFTTHQMLFDRSILRELRERIENLHGCSWIQAILRNIDARELSGSSDYETYGQYTFLHHAASMAIEYWFNRSMRRTTSLRNAVLLGLLFGGKFKSISFHSYNP